MAGRHGSPWSASRSPLPISLLRRIFGKTLPSGRQTVFVNRVGWAASYMTGAGLLERVRRGVYRLTPEGERLLQTNPSRIDLDLLRTFDAFVEWRGQANAQPPETGATSKHNEDASETPEEALDQLVGQLNNALETEVLKRVRDAEPTVLERVIVDLLIAMGYGGSGPTAGRVTGGSGDGGIDGRIREDALGLEEIALQAKRHAEGNSVSAEQLRAFVDAVTGAHMTKGVFVTTAGFTADAKRLAASGWPGLQIITIDGTELARLLVRHGVGVRTRTRHEIKRIDEDYFEQEV